MNCTEVEKFLNDFIDGELPEPFIKRVAEHQQSCHRCNESYQSAMKIRTLLADMPVPPPSEGFFERALNVATQESEPEKGKSEISKAVYGAVAAGLAVWFIAAGEIFTKPVDTQDYAESFYKVMVNNEVNTIKVAIDSEHELDEVQISIELTDNLELAGFANRTAINWNARLKKGINVIKLPISGLASGDGEIITRVQMNGKEKVMYIHTNYQSTGNVWHQINTTISA